jgi:hypothetical protein
VLSVYAVNINDLLKLQVDSVHPVNMLLLPLLTDQIINCEPGYRNGYAMLATQSANDRWPILIQIIRRGSGRYLGISRQQLRIYCQTEKGWDVI